MILNLFQKYLKYDMLLRNPIMRSSFQSLTFEGVRTKPRLSQFFSFLSLVYHSTKEQCAMCLPQHIMKITNFEDISGHFVQEKIKANSTIKNDLASVLL